MKVPRAQAISPNLFEKLIDTYSAMSIAESDKLKGIIQIGKKYYVCTGAVGNGTGLPGAKGYQNADAYEVVALKAYTGDLKPVYYREKSYKGYTGLRAKCNGLDYILIGERVLFKPFELPVQKSLF